MADQWQSLEIEANAALPRTAISPCSSTSVCTLRMCQPSRSSSRICSRGIGPWYRLTRRPSRSSFMLETAAWIEMLSICTHQFSVHSSLVVTYKALVQAILLQGCVEQRNEWRDQTLCVSAVLRRHNPLKDAVSRDSLYFSKSHTRWTLRLRVLHAL